MDDLVKDNQKKRLIGQAVLKKERKKERKKRREEKRREEKEEKKENQKNYIIVYEIS